MNLLGLTKGSFIQLITEMGFPAWRGDQLWNWIYKNDVVSFEQMSNLPAAMRERLAAEHSISVPEVVRHEVSADGTEKFLLALERDVSGGAENARGDALDERLGDAPVDTPESAQCYSPNDAPNAERNDNPPNALTVEMVIIPDGERNTLCISSQIGCCVRCAFCHTGTQQFERNLHAHEIVGQVFVARKALSDCGALNRKRLLTNIVMMGMGEPLHNYANVSAALQILMDPSGFAFSKRRVTLSTSGVVPLMKKCGDELGVNLAVSLHAPNDAIRSKLVPLNTQYGVKQLIDACMEYPNVNEARRITFEYVMLKGINDSDATAYELAELISGIHCKVNLIPWNPWPGAHFEASSSEQIGRFAKILGRNGITVIVRTNRGRDISAACGQLKSAADTVY
ncbi:MAG: 23S rRNA (adenine(2503)-C(2))-methyltransferase RlmN [Holosporales bacterium]|jgi:23S rRNA (adenine2503-C2)-methyltransferase|nr:23S rRNA (adenine(2503)-C(2))-methyltransferase RlmN [Holosporales bacterium]